MKRAMPDTNFYELMLKYLEIDKIRKVKESGIIDILVSNDNKTMSSEESEKAYKSVNEIKKFRTPDFIGFEEFKKMLRGVKFD